MCRAACVKSGGAPVSTGTKHGFCEAQCLLGFHVARLSHERGFLALEGIDCKILKEAAQHGLCPPYSFKTANFRWKSDGMDVKISQMVRA